MSPLRILCKRVLKWICSIALNHSDKLYHLIFGVITMCPYKFRIVFKVRESHKESDMTVPDCDYFVNEKKEENKNLGP